jgi:hydroxypyruvate isomerase
MKFSIVLSTQPSSFSALAYKGNLAGNIAKIKALGFDGVELAVRDPDQLDFDFLASILKEHNLPVPALGTGQAYGEEKLSFTDPRNEIREQAIARIKSQAMLAAKLNAMVIIGLVRGKQEGNVSTETAERWLIDALRECASLNEDIKFAIEPINRYETNLINTVQSGLALLEKVGMKNVGLLLDTFHLKKHRSRRVSARRKSVSFTFTLQIRTDGIPEPDTSISGRSSRLSTKSTIPALSQQKSCQCRILILRPRGRSRVSVSSNVASRMFFE